MHRSVFAPAVAFAVCAALAFAAVSPATAAAQASQSPPAQAKWVPPVRGVATIEVIRGASRKVGKELVTPLKIKNTSSGSISLLRVEELWYNAKREMVTAGEFRYKKPFLPGEIIEIESRSPIVGDPQVSQFTFSHANGKVQSKVVKKFE